MIVEGSSDANGMSTTKFDSACAGVSEVKTCGLMVALFWVLVSELQLSDSDHDYLKDHGT